MELFWSPEQDLIGQGGRIIHRRRLSFKSIVFAEIKYLNKPDKGPNGKKIVPDNIMVIT